ncbi:alcohol dehydrogenase family protein [Magnetospira sp. QH-2]|uniref:alcohol dehydrogenase family protein n=1 Tax=Magnetospira sp. (strain QH-2) TaxID=1288970 RepID=UPI0003E80AAF|nr:alcohol dehydrogenase family protein [Magnetospira sp. QH-2]CCQ72202.1 putative NADP-dependent reductase [Magnetospira sp. QH-2]
MTNQSKTMRGVWLTGHGDLNRLVVRDDIPIPTPGSGEVLIAVGAAAVNNTDLNTRLGWYSKSDGAAEDATWGGAPLTFPRIQGIDVCGRIVGLGKGVVDRRLGERVLVEPCLWEAGGELLESPWFLGSECDGGFAQYVVVAARHAHAIQSPLSDAELASFPCSYSTAENMLTRAKVGEGDRVLVTGASGGVGSAAVQLARARGAEVVAVTSQDKAQALEDLGASRILDRTDNPVTVLGGDSLDVVIDLVAGPAFPSLLDALRPRGRYAVAGAIAGPMVALDVRTLYLKDLSFFGCTVLEPEVFPNLVRLIETEKIHPLVAEIFPLEKIAEAQTRFVAKRHVGKIVLTVP